MKKFTSANYVYMHGPSSTVVKGTRAIDDGICIQKLPKLISRFKGFRCLNFRNFFFDLA